MDNCAQGKRRKKKKKGVGAAHQCSRQATHISNWAMPFVCKKLMVDLRKLESGKH